MLLREEALSNPTGGLNWKFPFYAALFATLDLSATVLSGIALLYVDASIVSILKGFIIVFTKLLTWMFLGQRPISYENL
ncbi:hypothetical protein TVAG_164150 [Trichomonas vaginalis G3]|uniref:Uncharacterized protein n=1 Tax=Trichomonas vaginalis (strain ATCC PRA-98 / G3) TaxID=412133 RepID=A2E1V7_TRIV3|nr:negative regulation of mitochondrial outer membrane permeabilization protein [Trichomonas vaginalis G3]EAY13306.1 hypothetical protein TVAG_164150 [Trichomonas vaginalis G3]KAI5540427.1 negative regulation of mitochondrial outer membrane permeabilization protein [Trichomonas vaginalis G3]|eukprot:XP_001325529.1 hypothetical protein [Trichomonas vaginalis G3]